MPLADYLALQAGTGVMALLRLAVKKGVLSVKTRMWSAVRLVSIVLVPVLGVLIMSESVLFRTKMVPAEIGSSICGRTGYCYTKRAAIGDEASLHGGRQRSDLTG
jgi:hypothetical protein